MMPRRTCQVSVVIPVHGHPVLLDDAIWSVHREMEAGTIARLVLVNDGCKYAETREAIEFWQTILGPRMVVLHSQNGGLSAARNRGIAAALRLDPALDAVFLLDSDNMLVEGAGAAMKDLLLGGSEADWFYPEFDFFGQAGNYVTEPRFDLFLQAQANQCDAGSLIRRRVFEAGLTFDETMRHGYEDWDFWLQAAQAGFRGRSAQRPLLHYRKRPASMLSHSHEVDRDLRRFLQNKHRWLFNQQTLVALEAQSFPRFAIVTGDERTVTTCTDPDHQTPLTGPAFERMVLASMADPLAHHAPVHLIFWRDGVEQHLRTARMLHSVLWTFERRALRDPHDLDLLFLDKHRSSAYDVTMNSGNPERHPDAICVRLQTVQDWIREGDWDRLRQLDMSPSQEDAASWTLRSPLQVDALASRAGAGEVARGTLLALARSSYRAALRSGWAWRQPGAAVRRDETVQIPRSVANGGVTFPLVRAKGRHDIAIVLPICDLGGVERVAASIARELASAGYRMHLFVLGDRPIDPDAWALEPFATVNLLPDPALLDWSGPEFMGTAEPRWGEGDEANDLLGLLGGMDVVINAHSAALHKVADRLRRRGILMIDHEHLVERSDYGRPYGPPHLALAYEHSYDLFLTCSQQMRTWMHANGVPREKLIATINAPGYPMAKAERNFLTSTRFSGRGRRQPLRVLFLGRLDKQKGIDRVCEIFQLVADKAPRTGLTVAGRSVVEQSDMGLDWPSTTRFLGAVRGAAAITQLLSQTDILILPSLYEGLPLSILEAQRCGVVPIATEAGAVDEAIRNGHNGFIVSQENCATEMGTRILQLDRDRDLLAEMAAAAAGSSPTWAAATAPLRAWLQKRLPAHLPAKTSFPSHPAISKSE